MNMVPRHHKQGPKRLPKPRPRPGPGYPAEGYYDPRQGAAGYAPNIALFGSLTAPAVILFFQTTHEAFPTALRSLAVGLLITGMIGSLVGSFALAAIGAESALTANIVAGVMYAAVSVVTSLLSVLGAFEVLVVVYLPSSVIIFNLLISGASIFGVLATTFALGDSPKLGPRDLRVKNRWHSHTNVWLRSGSAARTATLRFSIFATLPILASTGFRLIWPHVLPDSSETITNIILATAMLLALAGSLASLTRMIHPLQGQPQRAIRPWEAIMAAGSITIVGTMFALLLPSTT